MNGEHACRSCIVIVALCFILLHELRAQSPVRIGAPARSNQSRYFEHVGADFAFRQVSPGGAVFFRGIGSQPLPGTQVASLGLRGSRGNSGWQLGLNAGQGWQRTSSLGVPNLSVSSGGFGFVTSSVRRPFVVGVFPIVGDRFYSPVRERWARIQQEKHLATEQGRKPNEAQVRSARSNRRAREDDPPIILGRRPTSGT